MQAEGPHIPSKPLGKRAVKLAYRVNMAAARQATQTTHKHAKEATEDTGAREEASEDPESESEEGQEGGGAIAISALLSTSSMQLDESFIPRFVLPGAGDGYGGGAGTDFGSTLSLSEGLGAGLGAGLSPIFQSKSPAGPPPSHAPYPRGGIVCRAGSGSMDSRDVDADLSATMEHSLHIRSDDTMRSSDSSSQPRTFLTEVPEGEGYEFDSSQPPNELSPHSPSEELFQALQDSIAEVLSLQLTVRDLQDRVEHLYDHLACPVRAVDAVVGVLKEQSKALTRSPSPLMQDDEGSVASYLDFDVAARIDELRSPTYNTLWRVLFEGVLGQQAGDVDEADYTDGQRYTPAYYRTGLFSGLAVLMKVRSERVNVLSRVVTMALSAHHAPKKLISLLNKLGYSESYNTALRMAGKIRAFNQDLVRERMEQGRWKTANIAFDNINMYLRCAEQRSDSRSEMSNTTVAYVMPIRVFNADLPQHVRQLADKDAFPQAIFTPSRSDFAVLRRHTVWLIESTLREQWPKGFKQCPGTPADEAVELEADRASLPPALRAVQLTHREPGPIPVAAVLPFLPFNEAETIGMIQIMRVFRDVSAHPDVQGHTPDTLFLHGDQLTVSRIRSATDALCTGDDSKATASIRDIQYLQCFLGFFHWRWAHQSVSIDTYWGALGDVGSVLWFKRALGGRKDVTKDCKNFYACQEFLWQLVRSYITGCTIALLHEWFPTWAPASNSLPSAEALAAAGFASFQALMQRVVEGVLSDLYSPKQCEALSNVFTSKTAHKRCDNSLRSLVRATVVHDYARQAVRRADGIAMQRTMRFGLRDFLGFGSFKYSIETAREMVQINGILSPYDAYIAIMDRFEVDTNGGYVEKDMRVEHFIQAVKEPCRGNPNLSEAVIASSVDTAEVYRLMKINFYKQFGCVSASNAHTIKKDTQDVWKAASALSHSGFFESPVVRGRMWSGRVDDIDALADQKLAKGYALRIVQEEYARGSLNGPEEFTAMNAAVDEGAWRAADNDIDLRGGNAAPPSEEGDAD